MLDDMSQQLLDPPLAGKSHRGVDRVYVDLFVRRALIEQAQRVADAALGQAGDQLGRLAGKFKVFFPGDVRDVVGQLRRLDAAEVVALAAREDRRGDLLQLGRGEDEDQMLRRFLDDLQQRVEGREREHVHLVDDIDALLHRRGREDRFLAQRADVVHAVVGGGVELDHVEDRAVGDAAAGGARPAGIAVHRMLAVDRAGEDARAGRLAGASRTDEQIRVREPPRADLVFQRLGDMLLSDDVIEGLRPPSGNPAAHEKLRLMLLGSPPDMVHGFPLRETGPSSLLTGVRRHRKLPRSGIHPCYSGLQATGHRWLPD